MSTRNTKGFTLVEMLVVIAIIGILAGSLFKPIQSAINNAKATALQSSGRSIWLAIVSANSQRETRNKSPLWPADLAEDDDSGKPQTSLAYFNYLLSDGETKTTITADSELRVVSDLAPDSLIANGVVAAKPGSELKAQNLAWGVVKVGDATPARVPYLISRNYNQSDSLKQKESDDTTRLELDSTAKPFGNSYAVWVTRGGSTGSAPRKDFTMSELMGLGPEDVEYEYWPTKASQE